MAEGQTLGCVAYAFEYRFSQQGSLLAHRIIGRCFHCCLRSIHTFLKQCRHLSTAQWHRHAHILDHYEQHQQVASTRPSSPCSNWPIGKLPWHPGAEGEPKEHGIEPKSPHDLMLSCVGCKLIVCTCHNVPLPGTMTISNLFHEMSNGRLPCDFLNAEWHQVTMERESQVQKPAPAGPSRHGPQITTPIISTPAQPATPQCTT